MRTMKWRNHWTLLTVSSLVLCLVPLEGAFARCERIKATYWEATKDAAEEGVEQQTEDCKDATLPYSSWRSLGITKCFRYRPGGERYYYPDIDIKIVRCRGGERPNAWYCMQQGLACQ